MLSILIVFDKCLFHYGATTNNSNKRDIPMRKRLTKLFGILLLCVLNGQAFAEPTKILFNSFIPQGHLWNQGVLLPWLDMITEATEGRVVFEVPPTSLAAAPAQFDSVRKGVFDAGYTANIFITNRIKLPSIGQLPFTQVSSEASSLALWKTYEKYFAQANEYKDVHLLALWVGMGGDIVSTDAPILSVDDIKGRKMYALPGSTSDMVERAGAAVVAVPAVRSYELISAGTVDSFAGMDGYDFEMFKAMQYAKHVTKIQGGTASPVFSIFINKRSWNKISEQDRATITSLAREPLAKLMGVYDRNMHESEVRLTQEGVVYHDASPEFMAQLKQLGQADIDAWLEEAAALGVDGQAALDYYVAEAEKIEAQLQQRAGN